MMVLIFHGYLKDLFPQGRLEVEANSAAEAISALQGHPGFRREDGVVHPVTLPDFQSPDAIYEVTSKREVHMVPVLEGAGGNAGMFQILLGAVLIATGVGAPEGGYLIAGTTVSISGSALVMGGAMMMLGGVMQMLMPQPSISGADNSPRSNYLPANQNTVAIGTPIPLLIGRRRVYGHFLSFDIDAMDQATAIVPPPAIVADPVAWVESGASYTDTYGGSA